MGRVNFRHTVLTAATLWSLSAIAGPTTAIALDCSADPAPRVDWTQCRKRNLILTGSDLTGAKLNETDFTSTDLRGTVLEGADLSKSTLLRSSLSGVKAAGANFEKAVGFRTTFAGTDLSGADFAKSEMQRADFSKAILTDVDFEKSELGRAVFAGADINGTNFRFANLARADLRGAVFTTPLDFTSAYFYRTVIEGVDLSQAVGLAQWQIDMSCGNADTALPPDMKASQDWPCQDE